MIKLYQFTPIWNLPNASPFCTKLETYLRLAKIPYQVVHVNDPRKSPKCKLPFIKDGDKKIADSSFVIDYLKEKYGDSLDQDLTDSQKALAQSLQRLLEDHLYWVLFYGRWVDEAGWNSIKHVFFKKLPWLPRLIVPGILRKKFTKRCNEQGIGLYTDEERFILGKQDIDAIVNILGNQHFCLGDKPTSIDASCWGFLTLLLNAPIPSRIADYAKTFPSLINYDKRMRELFDSLGQK